MSTPEEPLKKRRRTSSDGTLPTPPALDLDLEAGQQLDGCDDAVNRAVQVLQTETAALAHVSGLYTTSASARTSLNKAIKAILLAQSRRGRLIVCGVGKSAFIAQKFVATCKSLSISASFLHACEAVHGDLGDVREGDIMLFVSYSGRTPELLNVLPHLPRRVSVIALTGQTQLAACRLLDGRGEAGILLPAPVHQTEEECFGVSAPTTSTTVALAVTDMLALTLAEQMHGKKKLEVFKKNHPGGAIGLDASLREVKRVKREVDVTVLELPSPSISGEDDR